MITAVNLEDRTKRGAGVLLNIFKRNRIRVEHSYCDTAAVKSVTYERYRGQVSWAYIERFVKSQRKSLLCPDTLIFPEESGFERYESSLLSRRMCENAALYLLRSINKRTVRTVLMDKNGEHSQMCESLIKYADPLYVVTEAPDIYIAQAEYLLSEKGAALRVSRSRGCLRFADLIISPEAPDSDMLCPTDCVILSGEKPSVRQNAPVICKYCYDLPKKYSEIKPGYLDDMYFASALYDLAGAHELGAQLFSRCSDGQVLHTRMSLTELLEKRLSAVDTKLKNRPGEGEKAASVT